MQFGRDVYTQLRAVICHLLGAERGIERRRETRVSVERDRRQRELLGNYHHPTQHPDTSARGILALHRYAAARRPHQSAYDLQQCALADAVAAKQSVDMPAVERYIDVVQYVMSSRIAERKSFDIYHNRKVLVY